MAGREKSYNMVGRPSRPHLVSRTEAAELRAQRPFAVAASQSDDTVLLKNCLL